MEKTPIGRKPRIRDLACFFQMRPIGGFNGDFEKGDPFYNVQKY